MKSTLNIHWKYADAETEDPILWPPDLKSWLIGKDPDAGKNEGRRRRGWQRMRWLESIADSTDMNLRKLQEIVKDREAWRATVQRVTKSRKRPCDWITKRFFICLLEFPALQVRQLMFLSFAHFRIRIVVLVSRTLRVLKTCQIIPAMETLGSFQLKYHNLLSKLLLLLSRFSRVQLCATA